MPKKNSALPKKSLAYGSLYMDQAESYEFAEMQINECIAAARVPHPQIIVAFDIVATPGQIASGRAQEWGRHVLQYCDKQYPNLSARAVGITDDDHRRVMRDLLITHTLTEKEIDGIHLMELE